MRPVTKQIVAHLWATERSSLTLGRVFAGIHSPKEMPQRLYVGLQRLAQQLAQTLLRNAGPVHDIAAEFDEVLRLLDDAPWTEHPVHGYVRCEEVAALDAARMS